MGWPTKGTGRNYNSHTGFGAFLGAYKHKVIMSKIYCRQCRYCESSKRNNIPIKPHKCVQNFPTNKSSKSMEAAAILNMAINSVLDRKFVIRAIVSDDDSVMRAHLRHKLDENDPRDKGKLPKWIYEPIFLADPSHRIKAISKHFYALANQNVSQSRVNKSMAKRLKKNWGYMVRQNRDKTIDEFVKNANAPLEHLFNNHEYCSPDWCDALKARKEGRVYIHPEGYCNKNTETGAKMYSQLAAITKKYGTASYLRQSMHPFNTQSNEALNFSQACLTPKSKSFHESFTFHHRHAIVVGVHITGE